MFNVPNLLTLSRLALVPVIGYFLATGSYAIALPLFMLAALTDLADGYLARRWKVTSRVGKALDPVADKLSMFAATVLLAWQAVLPLWLAIAIVLRDIVIVVGALAYRAALGHVEIAPTRWSKVNTFLEFAVLLLVMATAAGWIEAQRWLRVLFPIVLATVVVSGGEYMLVWGRKAVAERRSRRTIVP